MTKRLFRTTWFPALVARIFAVRPHETIWQWAEKKVFLTTTMAPEPMFYDSKKTPWTRRIQELYQHPYHRGRRIKRIVVKKSSQTGYTEAILNCIRWSASVAPRNVIYAIDSQEEAGNISDRLRNTLDALGEEILTDDKKDITTRKMTLRHMIIWLFGSAASGKFANKQAPTVICDEIEEYKKITGETSAVGNAASRMKKSAEGLLIELSKPKLKGGPIDKDHSLGNQEIFLVPCPYCGTYQEIAFERLQFKHCKNLMGEWDKERVLNETFLKCAATNCEKSILETDRYRMVQQGRWFETAVGSKDYDPEIVSQEMSDLYDCDNPRVWGEIAKDIIAAAGNHKLRQEKWNHRLGRAYSTAATRPEALDILRCKMAYRRGTLPWPALALILGSDVGKAYAKWVVCAVNASGDFAVVDWGNELHPSDIAAIVKDRRFHSPSEDKYHEIWQGVIDAKHRGDECYSACMTAPGQLWPVMGGGGKHATKPFAWGGIPTYPKWLRLLAFNDRDFKSELYSQRIKREVPAELDEKEAEEFRAKIPRLIFPEHIDTELITELTNEHFDPEKDDWERKGPNHLGDCIKEICVFWRWAGRAVFKRPTATSTTTPQTEDESGEAPAIAA